jgi:hypothetical protein
MSDDVEPALDGVTEIKGGDRRAFAAPPRLRHRPGEVPTRQTDGYRRNKRAHESPLSAARGQTLKQVPKAAITRFGSRYHPSLDDGRDNRTRSRDSRRTRSSRGDHSHDHDHANADHANAVGLQPECLLPH